MDSRKGIGVIAVVIAVVGFLVIGGIAWLGSRSKSTGGASAAPSASSSPKFTNDLSRSGQSASQYPQALIAGDVKIGIFQTDYNTAVAMQNSVNLGYDAWRTNPDAVIRNASEDYGFTVTDLNSLKTIASGGVDKLYIYEMSHKGKTYLVTLTQPFPGATIWVISSIEPR